MSDNLKHALRYASMGIPVFPVHFPKDGRCSCGKPDCRDLGKHPICRNGRDDATTDTEQITKWWTVNPSANIGAATGPGCGFVVDCDGPEGMQAFGELLLEHCDAVEPGPIVTTGGGGSHNWFAWPADREVRSTVKVNGTDIDIRGEGGYVIMPPSLHRSGATYTEHIPFNGSLPECPAPLLDRLTCSSNGSTNGRHGPMVVVGDAEDFKTCQGVQEGERHSTAAKYAGRQLGRGDAGSQVLLDAVAWNSRLADPLPEDELVKVVTDIEARHRGGEPTSTLPRDDRGNLTIPDITSAEFDAMHIEQVYIVEDILSKGEPLVVGGFMKSMKTSIALDLGLSIGCGRKFLGRFWSTPGRVGIVSGESGKKTLQETARRICKAKRVEFADADVFWHFVVPVITDPAAQAAVVDWIERRQLDVVLIDPLYLSFAGVDTAKYATNVIAMGSMLREFASVVAETGVTIVIVHHTSRTAHRAREFEPADLSDLSMAGLSEFARSWLMLSRRSAYEPGTGHHQLWMNTGGSAGHGGLYGVNIAEGTPKDENGRRWDVGVMSVAETKQTDAETKQASQTKVKVETADRAKQQVLKYLKKRPAGETLTNLRPIAQCSYADVPPLLEEMVEEGSLELCRVPKDNGRSYEGYRIPQDDSE